MRSFTNIFSALKFVEDDDDELTLEVNSNAKTGEGCSKSKSPKTSAADVAERRNDVKHELQKPLVWIDLEMTGLDKEKDQILEIACIITDGKLEQLIEGPDLIIHQSEDVLAHMNDWCQEHHTASGLTDGVRKSIINEQEAEQQASCLSRRLSGVQFSPKRYLPELLRMVLDFVSQHVAPGRALLAGNSVYVDLMFLQKYMPKLADYFPHVLLDVSSIRALCVRWYPYDAKKAPQKKKTHRALDDIKESIAELRYMQGAIFKRPGRR